MEDPDLTLHSDHSLQNSPTEPTPDAAASVPSVEVLAEAAHQVADRYPGLYGHQRTGIIFLLARQRAILADDMGMGKSRQAIVALREAAPDGNLLIVCPASVKLNWRREIKLIEPDALVEVVDGSSKPATIGRWTVVNYDQLGRGAAWVGQSTWAGAIVDEA